MRLRFLPLLALPVLLTGCGSMFEPPAADMSELPPPGAASDHGHHRHHGHHGESGTAYADDAPMPMPPGAMSPAGPAGEDGPPGGVTIGSGQTADITPHPATPDTEVSYGANNHP